jgi:hypothetical protein
MDDSPEFFVVSNDSGVSEKLIERRDSCPANERWRAGEMQAISADELDVSCLAARNVAAEMRRRIEYRLTAWGLLEIAHDTCLVATELIVNACRATPGEQIRIRFVRELSTVFLGVWDSSERMPEVRSIRELEPADLDLSPENFDDNGGWGLPLVQAIAYDCGVRRTTPNGKWVWARLAAGAR